MTWFRWLASKLDPALAAELHVAQTVSERRADLLGELRREIRELNAALNASQQRVEDLEGKVRRMQNGELDVVSGPPEGLF